MREARERFLDIRGLIELTYVREREVQQLLSRDTAPDQGRQTGAQPSPNTLADPPGARRIRVQLATGVQSENLQRSERLAQLIEEQLAASPSVNSPDSSPAQPGDPAQQQAAAQRQRLELAKKLLGMARDEMSRAADLLGKPSAEAGSPPAKAKSAPAERIEPRNADQTARHVDLAVEHLGNLRRLFFSIIEHLRETAQRQAELNDATEQVAGLDKNEDAGRKLGPLVQRQQELQSLAQQISQALAEQARQPPAASGVDPQQRDQLQQHAEQAAKAAKLVAEGGTEMQQAAQLLTHATAAAPQPSKANGDGDSAAAGRGKPASPLNAARDNQDAALQKLVEALSLLQPPQQQPQQNNDQQRQDQGQESQDQNEKSDQQPAGLDVSRLLQSVRDREAQRRRDREQRQRSVQDPVEKDW